MPVVHVQSEKKAKAAQVVADATAAQVAEAQRQSDDEMVQWLTMLFEEMDD